ncbi:MAG TPA: 6-carboxytetrahydropterin synthase [Candidatus Limnocylindria bacterium]|nr:6-carboxytetrahydropterin synthase [Candidatus Limnocylindria bacterium]
MYEVGVARSFHAGHQLDESPSAGDHHEHDYRVEAIVRGESLDSNGMLLDLDALGDSLTRCLRELESVDLQSLETFEGESTTVENVARHIWNHVCELVDPAPQLASLRVTVHESPDAWAALDQRLGA